MSKKSKIGLIILLAVLLVATPVWYNAKYSMEVAEPRQINTPLFAERILIATQGSAFKNTLVQEITNQLKSREVFINIIDVSALSTVKEDDWKVIVILHTWEMGQAPAVVDNFARKSKHPEKLIIVCTSGSGDSRMKGVDGITSASLPAEIPELKDRIIGRIESILDFNI